MIGFFGACLCLNVGLSLGFSDICNVLSTSSLMSSTFTWCMWLWWYCCWCVWLVFAGGRLFFLCRVLCISVWSLSRLGMISLELVFLRVQYKGQSLISY